jgi:hypothetical protein
MFWIRKGGGEAMKLSRRVKSVQGNYKFKKPTPPAACLSALPSSASAPSSSPGSNKCALPSSRAGLETQSLQDSALGVVSRRFALPRARRHRFLGALGHFRAACAKPKPIQELLPVGYMAPYLRRVRVCQPQSPRGIMGGARHVCSAALCVATRDE